MSGPRIPVSTYRLQFNQHLRFNDAKDLVAYLHELGITDLYASIEVNASRRAHNKSRNALLASSRLILEILCGLMLFSNWRDDDHMKGIRFFINRTRQLHVLTLVRRDFAFFINLICGLRRRIPENKLLVGSRDLSLESLGRLLATRIGLLLRLRTGLVGILSRLLGRHLKTDSA